MAETIYLNDGTMECIIGDKDDFLERLLHEKLGSDVATCFRSYINELNSEIEAWKDQAEEEETVADGYLQMCRDAETSLLRILSEFKKDRLNRVKTHTIVENAYNDLHNNL